MAWLPRGVEDWDPSSPKYPYHEKIRAAYEKQKDEMHRGERARGDYTGDAAEYYANYTFMPSISSGKKGYTLYGGNRICGAPQSKREEQEEHEDMEI